MKKEIIEKIKHALGNPTSGRNSMGASESFYNPYYMVGRCFTMVELESKDENVLVDLIKLAEFAGEAFY